ncbi:MAG: phosphoribosylanthranilate isomerase [Armatimonadetes bacterium]|nr:phosphoribosylanthranilate isomerase [Armatimonadota bacterium]MCX7968021.1 phosphoribosylanthranilate isomerase [Armatimonadota bacterium]MDW8142336.1 phosphoribosylanthranilate isomerase [Armatimonadota bacterium]
MKVKVKICGLTRWEDVQTAFESGADFCGFVVEVPKSPRNLTRTQAKILIDKIAVAPVVVTRGKSIDEIIELANFLSPFALQLHGDEPSDLVASLKGKVACQIWKAIPLPPATETKTTLRENILQQSKNFVKAGCDALVLDTAATYGFGGTGVVGSWELASELVKRLDVPCFLAGGLTPDNVLEAIAAVKPFGVDVSSGVESSPGVKDPEKIRLFCWRAKQKF